MNLHMCANRSSRLVAFPEFVLRLVRLLGAIQVLPNADGGGGVSDYLEKSVTKV